MGFLTLMLKSEVRTPVLKFFEALNIQESMKAEETQSLFIIWSAVWEAPRLWPVFLVVVLVGPLKVGGVVVIPM